MTFYAQKEDLLHVNKELVQTKMIKSKKGMSAWVWILIALSLIGIGIGIYVWLSGDASSAINSGASIPQPPALPN